MAEEARRAEVAASLQLAQQRKAAKEEREAKRKFELEKKKAEIAKRREEEKKAKEETRKKERELKKMLSADVNTQVVEQRHRQEEEKILIDLDFEEDQVEPFIRKLVELQTKCCLTYTLLQTSLPFLLPKLSVLLIPSGLAVATDYL